MKILIITHASFEKAGSIKTWAEMHGHQMVEVKPYEGEMLPEVKDYDLIVVMGGPQSPLTIEETPYLKDEIQLLVQAIKLNKKIIGVCLGAQLIGEALGAKTEKSPNREIGNYQIVLLQDAKDDVIFSKFSQKFAVMHWHNDMPGIPDGAILLAASDGCPRQIYRYGDRVYGFQCHFELTKDLVVEMIKHCHEDIKAGGRYVMTPEELINVNYDPINEKLNSVLDYLSALK